MLHQSDAYSESARRLSHSQAGGTKQLGDGCHSGPWYHLSALRPPRLALIHLLATCLWSFSHLDLFAFHQPQHPCTCLVATYCTVIPLNLLISREQQQPCIRSSHLNPPLTANQHMINKDPPSPYTQKIIPVCVYQYLCTVVCVCVFFNQCSELESDECTQSRRK